MKRIISFFAVCGLALVGCGATKPETGASSCGPSYTINENGRSITNTCAGIIPSAPVGFSIAIGSHFTILIGHEANGKLDFPVPSPTGPEIRMISRTGATITYAAVQVGRTSLVAHRTIFCEAGNGKSSSCTAANITVRRS